MDESKLEELRIIHHELAVFLRQSHQELNGVALVVGALRKTLEDDPAFASKYKKNLQDLQAQESKKRRIGSGFLLRLQNW